MFRHIVLFRVHDDISDRDVEHATRALRELGGVVSAKSWRVELSLDTRKGRVIIEEATFSDAESFELFRQHPEHIAVAESMAQLADWWVGDYYSHDN